MAHPLAFDVLIVGTGLAGLSAALHLAATHRVALVTKGDIRDGASGRAQGGIAAVLAPSDSFDSHVHDTLVAGAGLSDPEATRFVVQQAPAGIAWLRSLGVPFSEHQGELHLTREGGHAERRIVHADDATGAAVQRTLIEQVRRTPGITLLERHALVDLITSGQPGERTRRCLGLHAWDEAQDRVLALWAPHTILATGGVGAVYLHTSNPAGATGDGIAAAWRAGCRVANMEFIQFHPTGLHHAQERNFLITEAVRGEGGRLLLPDGTRFMPAHDARAELAPRDIVARAIDAEMKRHGLDCVRLDISHQPPDFVRDHFPNIHARCLQLGIDITREPIPVVPAVHYTCGGVLTDLHGRADLPGLHVIGEAACTGLHGANRLASNSLLECLVFARAAATDIAASAPAPEAAPPPGWVDRGMQGTGMSAVVAPARDELRRLMSQDVGIVRSRERLERATARIASLRAEVRAATAGARVHGDLLEWRNAVTVAELIVRSARQRPESRGCHFNSDQPRTLPHARATILDPS